MTCSAECLIFQAKPTEQHFRTHGNISISLQCRPLSQGVHIFFRKPFIGLSEIGSLFIAQAASLLFFPARGQGQTEQKTSTNCHEVAPRLFRLFQRYVPLAGA